MKKILALLVLLCAPVLGHTYTCADGVHKVANPSSCPGGVTAPGVTDIGTTSVRVFGTADSLAAGGTQKASVTSSVYPPGCSSANYLHANLTSVDPATARLAREAKQACVRWDYVANGTGATSFGQLSVPSAGYFSLVITSLPSNTLQYAHYLIEGGARPGAVSVVQTVAFTTQNVSAPPADGGPVDDAGQERYFGTGGDNLANCLAHATRCADPEIYFGVALPTGTNLALLNTSVFIEKPTWINYTGTLGDRVIFGSYKLNASNVPVWTVDNVFGTGTVDQKAAYQGSLTEACIIAGSCQYAGTFPIDQYSSEYDPIFVLYDNADHVEIRNVEFRLFRYYAFIAQSAPNTKNLVGLIIDGMDHNNNGDQPYIYGVNGGVWKNSTVTNNNTCKLQRYQAGATGSTAACAYSGWPGGLAVIGSDNVLVENNLVRDTFGEGINIFQNASRNIVRGNVVGDVHAIGVYLDGGSGTVVENNRIIMNDNSQIIAYNTDAAAFEGGIWMDQEFYGAPNRPDHIQDNLVRNNLIVNAGGGISVSTWTDVIANDPTLIKKVSGYVVGNTFVNSDASMEFWQYLAPGAGRVPYFYAYNNVFWDQPAGANTCNWRDLPNTDMNYNHYYVLQNDVDCRGANDTIGVPSLSVSNYATWDAYNPDNAIPAWANARPALGSPLIGTGVPLTSQFLNVALYGMAFTSIKEVVENTLDAVTWQCLLCTDGEGTIRTNPPDKGALQYAAGGAPAVPADAITISPNGHYFRKNGAPFNWVGCTAWLGSYLTNAKMDEYLTDRAGRGCNVVQGVILNNLGLTITDANGPISSTSPFTMRASTFTNKIDYFFSRATALGMNILFPLCWSANCKRDMVDSPTNARTYANYIVGRYAAYSNVMWAPAGEYTKMSTNPPNYENNNDQLDANELAIIDALIAGITANKHPYSLVTIHPDGWASSTDTARHPGRNFHVESWLNFNSLQSSSSNYENIVDTEYDYNLSPARPTYQAEQVYEGPTASPWQTRLFAWSARLMGAAGYTYGHSEIWSFNTGWEAYLSAPGADDIFTHYKTFWNEHHSETMVRSRDWLTGDRGSAVSGTDTYEVAMRSAAGDKLMVYAPQGDYVNVITNNVVGTIRARWFDPRLGGYTLISNDVPKTADTTFDPPGSIGIDNDWVLVLD